ncbi:sulfatase-like hydrolase/transferase, partial [Escherichia coli]
WMEQHRVSAPNRPWFCYFSTPAVHAPHHAPAEWINKYQGTFDAGWDVLREEIYAEQLRLGVIPEHTTLTTRPEEIPAWSEYPERYR